MEQNSTNNKPNEEIQESKTFTIVIILFLLAFLGWIIYQGKVVAPKEFDEKVKAFNSGSTLICHQMGSSTLVSKENGWSIYNNKYFLKDGTLLDIYNNCFMDKK